MKDLLVSTRPSYQHLLMKLSRAPLRRSTFWFLAESEKSEALLAFSCPLAATPPSASLDQNKLKKALWTLSVFNLSLPLVLTLSLPFVSHSPPVFFLSCSSSPKKCIYKTKKKHEPLTSAFHRHTHLLAALYPASDICVSLSLIVSPILSLSPCFTFSPCLPFCSLIYRRCECALPWLSSLSPHTVCPAEDPSCSYGNQLATMLRNIIMLAQKEISFPSRVVR